jgi:hypothetical protein
MLYVALVVVAVTPGLLQAAVPDQKGADSLFKVFLDMNTDWEGKFAVDKQEVKVRRLVVNSAPFCQLCKISSLRLAFQFDGKYEFPPVSKNEYVRAIEPTTLCVHTAFHGDHLIPIWGGSELVLTKWEARPQQGGADVYDFVVHFWKSNNYNHPSTAYSGSLKVKNRSVEGTISGKDLSAVKFSFSPIPRAVPDKK